MLKVDKEKCLRCGGCVGVCPTGALKLTEHGIEIDEEKCIECGNCKDFCPVGAIDIEEEE